MDRVRSTFLCRGARSGHRDPSHAPGFEPAAHAIALIALQLSSLRQHGVRVALDDFGTGYSSLSYLARYPVDTVKIDQSFVRGLEHDPEARSIVHAIILLAHGLTMTTVAEGVETPGQQYRLKELGCDELQGFLFAQPAPSEDLSAVIARATALSL